MGVKYVEKNRLGKGKEGGGFNVTEFGNIKNQSGEKAFVLTVQGWVERTGAIGLISKTGRYGGTYAHRDIAFKFASWISVEFKYLPMGIILTPRPLFSLQKSVGFSLSAGFA